MGDEGAKASGAELLKYLDGLVEQLRGYVPSALREFESQAVHQARVATRRLGAGLELLSPLVEKEGVRPLKRVLRKLRRRLGPHRDMDVLIEAVEAVMGEASEHAGAGDFLLRVLRSRREQLREETLAAGGVNRMIAKLGVYEGVRLELAEGLAAGSGGESVGQGPWSAMLAEGVHAGFDEFSALADVLSHRLAEREGLGGLDPHELRIAGKHLRYCLEMADASGMRLAEVEKQNGGAGSVLKVFKKMQDELGLWHDRVVLAEMAVRAVEEHRVMHGEAVTAAGVLRLAGSMLDEAWGHLEAFGALWMEKGTGLEGAIHRSFPLSRDMRRAGEGEEGRREAGGRGSKGSEVVGQDFGAGTEQTSTLP